MWGATGWPRMFDAEIGGQVAWLLPAALSCSSPGWCSPDARRAPTAPAPRSSCGAAGCSSPRLMFSLMAGIFHAYYTVALAPAIGALVGMGAVRCGAGAAPGRPARRWPASSRSPRSGRGVLLGRSADLQPWLRAAVLIVGLGRGVAACWPLTDHRLAPRLATAAVLAAAVAAALAGPAAYALQTAVTPHTGAIPYGRTGRGRRPGRPGGRRSGRLRRRRWRLPRRRPAGRLPRRPAARRRLPGPAARPAVAPGGGGPAGSGQAVPAGGRGGRAACSTPAPRAPS